MNFFFFFKNIIICAPLLRWSAVRINNSSAARVRLNWFQFSITKLFEQVFLLNYQEIKILKWSSSILGQWNGVQVNCNSTWRADEWNVLRSVSRGLCEMATGTPRPDFQLNAWNPSAISAGRETVIMTLWLLLLVLVVVCSLKEGRDWLLLWLLPEGKKYLGKIRTRSALLHLIFLTRMTRTVV